MGLVCWHGAALAWYCYGVVLVWYLLTWRWNGGAIIRCWHGAECQRSGICSVGVAWSRYGIYIQRSICIGMVSACY